MKKAMAGLLLFVTVAAPVFAADSFAQREADRSGVSGTLNMIGNSVSGFFSSLGHGWCHTKTK